MINNFRKIIFSTLTVVFLSPFLGSSPANAAGISFTSAGSQLDHDDIYDIVPDRNITFSIFLDTNNVTTDSPWGPVGVTGNIDEVLIELQWDKSELTYTGFKNFAALNPFQPGAQPPGERPNNGNLFLTNVRQNRTRKLGEINFKVENLDNNGISDFTAKVLEAKQFTDADWASFDLTPSFSSQIVEVQPRCCPRSNRQTNYVASISASLLSLFVGKPAFASTFSCSCEDVPEPSNILGFTTTAFIFGGLLYKRNHKKKSLAK